MARTQDSGTNEYREPLQDNVHSQSKQKECNDVFFLLLFLLFFIMTLVFAFQYGSEFVVRTSVSIIPISIDPSNELIMTFWNIHRMPRRLKKPRNRVDLV